MNNLYATIDVGTHSSILSISRYVNNKLDPVYEKLSSLNLGKGLVEGDSFSKEKIDALMQEIKKYLQDVARLGARLVSVGGTHVFRIASNGSDVMKQLQEVVGCPCEILSQDREIELVKTALTHQFDTSEFSIIDIGGGSTEIFTPKMKGFLPLGAVNLFEVNGFHPDQGNRIQIAKAVKKLSLKLQIENLIGIGGSLTTLAMMILGDKVFNPQKVNGMVISSHQVTEWIERLADLKPEFRAQVPGLPKSRIDYIGPGLCLIEGILKRYKVESFKISTWGLRNGLALEYINQRKS